jgi:hypothetical protein
MKTSRLLVATALVAVLASCSDPEADWQRTAAENTEAAWQAFMEKYPEGEWAQRAQAELDTLADAADWERARTADVIEAYGDYLLDHPTGAHMGEARQRISELETEAAWTVAAAAGTREALEEFLVRYGDTPQGDQARSRLVALAAPPAAAAAPTRESAPAREPAPVRKPAPAKSTPVVARGDYQVQLGAFSAPAKARAQKAELEKSYRGLVGALTIQAPSGAAKLYRVRSSAMSEAAARSACRKLKGSGQDCVVVPR